MYVHITMIKYEIVRLLTYKIEGKKLNYFDSIWHDATQCLIAKIISVKSVKRILFYKLTKSWKNFLLSSSQNYKPTTIDLNQNIH